MTDQQNDNQNQEETHPQLSPSPEKKSSKKASTEETRKELQDAIEGSQEVLCKIIAPLQIFPVTLTLDRSRITAYQNKAAGTEGAVTIPIEDVTHVAAQSGPLQGYVMIEEEALSRDEPYRAGPFRSKDAKAFAAMAQGYILALKRGIDLNAISTDELKGMLIKLGET